MKKRLILHLGLPKTGTTTIQRFLGRNRRNLAGSGVIYPTIKGSMPNKSTAKILDAHHALALELRKDKRDENGQSVCPPRWSTIFRQIESSGAHTALISSERLSGGARHLNFDGLRTKFSEFDVTGLIYLRSQESWVVSYYGQKVRGEARLACPLADFRYNRTDKLLVYSQILDRLLEIIPLNRLVVGNFDGAVRSGLLADFLNLAGLPIELASDDEELKKKNVALPHWTTLFLVECNAAKVPMANFVLVRDALSAIASQGADIDLRPGLDVASPTERRKLRDLTNLDAGRLADKYGLTFETQSNETPYRPFDREDFDTIRKALTPLVDEGTRRALESMPLSWAKAR